MYREKLPLSGLQFSLAFAPQGRTLVVPDGRTLLLFDVTDPVRPRPLAQVSAEHLGNIITVAWSPNGAILATGSEDGSVILWDATDAGRPHPLGQPLRVSTDNRVSAVEFAPDGRTLAVATLERSVELWDVTRPARPARLGQTFGDPNSTAPVDVAFAADGRLLAVPGANGATLWDLQRATRPARHRAGPGLPDRRPRPDPDEWANAVPGVDYEPTCG